MTEFTFKIPKSNIMVKAKKHKNDKWSLFTIHTNSFTEKKLRESLTTDQAAAFSMLLISKGSSTGFFGKNTLGIISALKKHIKSLKKEICHNQDSLT